MPTTSTTGIASNKPVLQDPAKDPNNALRDVDTSDFLNLMITELKNQDPLNPLDNAKILEQVGQLQSINASKNLSDTLSSVLLGQNISSASSMIGKSIAGLDDSGKETAGAVESAYIEKGQAKLVVGDSIVSLSNVRQILGN